jgi:hypothetical protein
MTESETSPDTTPTKTEKPALAMPEKASLSYTDAGDDKKTLIINGEWHVQYDCTNVFIVVKVCSNHRTLEPVTYDLYAEYASLTIEFAVYWQDHPKLKAGAVLATLEGHCNLVVRNSNLTAPILSPAFCSDVSLGRVTCGPNPNDITEGLSPFHIRTMLSPK